VREFNKRIKLLWLLSLAFWLATSLSGGELFAQSGAQKIDLVRQRMEDGLALFVGGDPEGAAKIFEAGYADHPYSAFLFNAGVCFEKLGKSEEALAKYREYMRIDPDAPDTEEVKKRVGRLEGTIQSAIPGSAPPPPPPPPGEIGSESMRSLVIVESEPEGAPVRVFRPSSENAAPFKRGQANAEWAEIVTTTAPASLSLSVGLYHVVIDKFAEYNASDTRLRVSPGHVHHFKANLSQGVFMAFLRVSSNVKGAHLWLDDAQKTKPEWGTTPYGELVTAGVHEILIEAPGFQPLRQRVELQSGERKEVEARLARVNYGFLRVSANLHVEPDISDRREIPDVRIALDGQDAGVWRKGTKPLDVRVSAGIHRVLVTADGYKDFEADITVPKGQILPIVVNMIPKYPRGAAWAQTVIATGLIGGGIYFGLESEQLKEDLKVERGRGTLEAEDSRITRGRWYAIGADVGFAAGGVLAGFATWNFIKDPLPESSHKLGELLEFEDPMARLPAAQFSRPRLHRLAREVVRSRGAEGPSRLLVTPAISRDVAGLFIGGQF
jgi:tetratricopeptide (TPR) repeat protein